MSPVLETTHTVKCWSDIFPTILTYINMLENCQNNISVCRCSPIQDTKFYSSWNLMKPGSKSETYWIELDNIESHFHAFFIEKHCFTVFSCIMQNHIVSVWEYHIPFFSNVEKQVLWNGQDQSHSLQPLWKLTTHQECARLRMFWRQNDKNFP